MKIKAEHAILGIAIRYFDTVKSEKDRGQFVADMAKLLRDFKEGKIEL